MEHISTSILTRIALVIMFKIPVEICQFNGIPTARSKRVVYVAEKFSQGTPLTDLMAHTFCAITQEILIYSPLFDREFIHINTHLKSKYT